MKYLMIIADDEKTQLVPGDEGHDALMAEYQAFGEMVQKMGAMVDGARLQPTSNATTVRVRNGKVTTTDGPFAETKEQFGGYYVIDCKDLDQAIEIASKIPTAKNGSIEVRPLWDMANA